ncbi:TIGR04423 family type III CRISPR-associated protein [Prevotella denticola]|uniref:TIGR04423 family type III CRISPR-associated protein n=1 Tax=Prevotella denticola TaxID=28129 RepID=UPI0024203DA3|nr:TIGR04423 family type III CRISPR-associated protein [Prevotella denticola]
MMNINFDLPYEGYLWMSNKNHPCVYCPESLIDRGLFDGHNPFVAEGYLFNHEKGISISIKYVDGRYRIYIDKVKPSDFNSKDTDRLCYLTQRMDHSDALWAEFLRYWTETPDPACHSMNVLEIEKELFVGFKKKEE